MYKQIDSILINGKLVNITINNAKECFNKKEDNIEDGTRKRKKER